MATHPQDSPSGATASTAVDRVQRLSRRRFARQERAALAGTEVIAWVAAGLIVLNSVLAWTSGDRFFPLPGLDSRFKVSPNPSFDDFVGLGGAPLTSGPSESNGPRSTWVRTEITSSADPLDFPLLGTLATVVQLLLGYSVVRVVRAFRRFQLVSSGRRAFDGGVIAAVAGIQFGVRLIFFAILGAWVLETYSWAPAPVLGSGPVNIYRVTPAAYLCLAVFAFTAVESVLRLVKLQYQEARAFEESAEDTV